MSANANNIEKVFEFYLEFPEDVRMVVIDEMSPDDRCRFTRCSSLCQKEAKKSKQYIYAMYFRTFNHSTTINVKYGTQQVDGYSLVFESRSGSKYIICYARYQEMWRVELDSSEDVFQLGFQHFKNLLQLHQNTIKQLTIHTDMDIDFGVDSLRNLEMLDMSPYLKNIVDVISKKQKPLKEIVVFGRVDNIDLENVEYICQVQKEISIPHLKLNYDQLMRLSAKVIDIHIGELTPKDIFNFINVWQNGEIRENIRYCSWDLSETEFNVEELCRLLGVVSNNSRRQNFQIKHNKEVGRSVELNFLAMHSLLFEVNN